MLSVVSPCYNEQEVLELFYNELKKHLEILDTTYELIFVNDGSKDETLSVLKKLKSKDSNITILDFSRNFGKEAAIYAGLREAKGDFVVLMDADLQDPPALLKEMYDTLQDDTIDNVATMRVNRKGEPRIRSFFARMFYKLINKLIDVEIVDGARDYRMMKRHMVDAIVDVQEYHRFSKGIFSWVGFNTKYIEYVNVERAAGETKWSFYKLFKYAIEGIVAFTTSPLRIATIIGSLVSITGFIYMIYIAIKAIAYGDPVDGFPSLVVIITLLGGIQLLFLGILGEYLARTYIETKKRPVYIIRKKL